MNFFKSSEKMLQKPVLLLLLMAVSAFAWGQEKKTQSAPAPKPSAPAPHASAPAPHASAPAHTQAPTTQHTTPGHTTPPGHTTTQSHATTPTHTATPTHATTSGTTKAGTTKPGTTPNKPAIGNAGKPGTKPTERAGPGPRTGGPTVGRAANHTPPGRQVSLKGGGTAHVRPNGQIRSVDRNGMHIEHNLHGGRKIESTRNGARVVTTGKHSGYVQRPYVTRNGRTYVSRTTVVNNVTYTGVYRSYGYGGYCCYYGYSPAYYYNPGYYGWAYNPWPAPVTYGWGWGGSPWYGYYGGYFAPYPVYPTAAFWLTDYLIAANLQAAYAAQAEASAEAAGTASDAPAVPTAINGLVASTARPPAAPADSSAVALTPEVKQAIAEEVKAQLAAEQTAASQSGSSGGQSPAPASGEVPPALDPARRTFVVSADLAVVADGQECALTQGDIITRLTDAPDADQKVNVSVASSKKTDCGAGTMVAVSVDDLQEMHNHFQEQLDEGMKSLASKQGTGGLPKAPDTSTVASDVPPPSPDNSAAKTLQDQQASADQTETQVKQEAASAPAGGQQ